ncbi:hypothetical protein FB566_1112 [Stackebrandtia endophytica]|uniref:Uncharacterized protein n=1 Tax=Stackebrandtia endophytica TaxID=1496996 RepID=A0A543ASN8_9ACTN|nr:PA2928 family protein [Stackebrandtia endophytica]TQL75603.1 hypothetical protein FB566_1112 [Stackebrandtia endophytica]
MSVAKDLVVKFRWWLFIAGAVVITVMWIVAAMRSKATIPLYNAFLVLLVVYLVVMFLGLNRYLFPGRTKQESDGRIALRLGTALLVLTVGGIWLLSAPTVSTMPSPTAAIGMRDGREVAIVTHEWLGPQGLHQEVFVPSWQHRVTAIDIETGQHVWSVMMVEGLSPHTPRVLAAGDEYAYVATVQGLWVLDIDDGSVVAEPGDIEGLDRNDDLDHDAAAGFVFDASQQRVITQSSVGMCVTSVDTLIATEVSDDEQSTLEPLFAENDMSPGISLEETESIVIEDAKVLVGPEGAVGSPGEYLVVNQSTDLSVGYEERLLTVNPNAGKIIDSIDIPEKPFGATTSTSGSSVVVMDDTWGSTAATVVITPTGQMTFSDIGHSGFFGEPL